MRARWAYSSRSERVLGMRYPFGLSRKVPSVESVLEETTAVLDVIFVAEKSDLRADQSTFDGMQGQLLLKAVVQGLEWKRDRIELLFIDPHPVEGVHLADESEKSLAVERVRQICRARRPKFVVLLGTGVGEALGFGRITYAQDFDRRCFEREGTTYLVTADVENVSRSIELKRRFWNDLKSISAKIGE